MQGLVIAGGVMLGLFLLGAAMRTGRPIRTMAKSMGLGALGLLFVNLTAPLSGLSIGINAFTVGCSLVGGLPGVIGLLAVRALWI